MADREKWERKAVEGALNAQRQLDEDEGDSENAVGELLVAFDALCRLVVGEERYQEIAKAFREVLARDAED